MVPRQSLESKALRFIRQHRMIASGDHLVVGVSGGPDSMALLHVLKALQGDLGVRRMTAAHFEHGLRGTESLEDRAFVERVSAELGVECRCGAEDVRTAARRMRVSWEMAARVCRHRFFRILAEETRSKIALAHNANDQAEEILLRLCRGTGPSGLGGMHPVEGSGIVRPLLFAARGEIVEYLEAMGIEYRRDSSNEAPVCQRNRIRLQVMPLLEEIMNPGVVGCLQRHAQLVRDEEDFWKTLLTDLWPRICPAESEAEVRLRTAELRELHPALLRRALRYGIERLQGHLQRITARHIESISILVKEGRSDRRLDLPSSLEVLLEGEWLVLSLEDKRLTSSPASVGSWFIQGPGVWSCGERALKIEELPAPVPFTLRRPALGKDHSVVVDADTIRWPLCLRDWKPGDRFQPLGISGHKKIQDFFVDMKVPRRLRGSIPILCDTEKICWIVGHRLDDRVKVTSRTRKVLLIACRPSGPEE